MLELQQLSAAFDPLTADTEGVKMAPIISPSPADLLVAAASVRLSAVSRTPPTPGAAQHYQLATETCTQTPL